jgi:outer membrane receptor protein involved in Fe transport
MMSTPGFAQGSGLVLEEVIVTAQKRAESIQDIAASVSVVGGEELQEFNIFDFSAIEQLTAGLTLNNSSARNQTISLRGMTYDSEGPANPVVDAYWNSLPARSDVVFNQMFDIERIELLRGPQGTLQGQTSPGGAIMVNTRRADVSGFSGLVQTTGGDRDRFATQIGVNVPVIEDKLAVRIAGNYDESELNGIKNIYTGTKQSGRNTAGRISIAWDATDRISADLVYEYSEQDINDFKDMTGSDLLGNGNPSLGKHDRKGLTEADNKFHKRNQLTMLEINWDISDSHQLTSISGYQDTLSDDWRDIDRSNAVPDAIQVQAVEIKNETFTQEIRLSTAEPAFGFWDYIVGVFYKDRDLDTHFYRWLSPGGALAINAPKIPSDREEWGIFNHNTFEITDVSRVQVGIRWSKVDQKNRYDFSLVSAQTGDHVFGPIETIPDALDHPSDDKVTGSLKYLHDFTLADQEVMAYASLDTSYRPGGMTIEPRLTDPDDLLFDDETSWSFEVGFKSTLWDQRVQLNGAAFYQEFDGYISRATGVLVDTTGDGNGDSRASGIMFNGDAIISGAELDGTALLTENWTAGGGITYVDAKFDDAQVPCDGAPGTYNGAVQTCASDGRIGDEPNWSASIHSEYVLPMGELEPFIRGVYKYTGFRMEDNIKNNGFDGKADSYGVLNLYTGVRDNAGVWEASVWATNLFDKDADITKFPAEVSNGQLTGYRQANIIPERAFGVTGRYNF